MATQATKSAPPCHVLPLDFNKPGRLRPDVLAKIKAEVLRIGNNSSPEGVKFAEKMFARYPELRSV